MKNLIIVLLIVCFGTTSCAQPSSFTSHDGIKIVFDDEGSGEVVLLLHGFINSRKSWGRAELKTALINSGYRVIVPDLRGNGESDKPHQEEYWNDNNEVKDIISLMDHLSVKSYTAVGYSRGSIVLANLLTRDNRISKAVFGGMGIECTDAAWEIPGQFARAFSGEDELSEMTEGAVNYAKSIEADLKCLSLQQKYQPYTSAEKLQELTIPVLVICGNQDNENNKANRLEELFQNGEFSMVEGEHNHTYKQANFAEVVLRFIEK